MEESVRQGWHTGGRAPYGYLLEQHPHPNPSKAREGKAQAPAHPRPNTCAHRPDDLRGLLRLPDLPRRNLRQTQSQNVERFPPPAPNRKDENDLPHTWSGADRLRLLWDELAVSTASSWEENDAKAKRLEGELEKIKRSLRAQTLRLEEHDDHRIP
jgi:hypothetical protein